MPDATPQMGDNSRNAPLEELLAAETAEFRTRAEAILAGAAKATIADAAGADKVTLIGTQIAKCIKLSDEARLARTKPHRDAETAINAYYGQWLTPLNAAKKKMAELITAWGAKLRSDALAKQKADVEQARLDKIAADQAAALAALSDDPADAVEAEQQQAAAASKAVEAAAPVHVSVKTDGASASFVTRKTGKVTDLKAFLSFLAEHYTASAEEWAQGQANYLARSTITLPEGCGMERVETKEARFGS